MLNPSEFQRAPFHSYSGGRRVCRRVHVGVNRVLNQVHSEVCQGCEPDRMKFWRGMQLRPHGCFLIGTCSSCGLLAEVRREASTVAALNIKPS
jgi:hypothetical protein